MNKKEYLAQLENEISSMSYGEVKDILAEIDEHFTSGVADGKTEEQIAEALGSPYELGRSYTEGTPKPEVLNKSTNTADSSAKSEGGSSASGIVFVILFNLLVGIEMWLALLGFVLGIIGANLGLVTGAIALFLTCGAVGPFMGVFILGGLTLLACAVALFALSYFATKLFIKGFVAYCKWNAKLWKEGF